MTLSLLSFKAVYLQVIEQQILRNWGQCFCLFGLTGSKSIFH